MVDTKDTNDTKDNKYKKHSNKHKKHSNKYKKHSNEYKKHAKKYTKLLGNYVENAKKSNKIKNRYKRIFFWVIITMLCALTIVFSKIVLAIPSYLSDTGQSVPIENMIGIITACASSFATLLVSILKLPQIIAKYLFNIEEDENMTKIIGHIQTFDTNMYRIERFVENGKMQKFLQENEKSLLKEEGQLIVNPDNVYGT